MAQAGKPKPPAGGFGWVVPLRNWIDRACALLNVAGTLLIFGLVLLVNADVAGRTFFLAPISGVPEIVSMSIVAIVFLQVAQAWRMGRFTRTEAFLNALEKGAPRVRSLVELAYAGAALALVWFLLAASYPLLAKEWERGSYIGTVGDFTFPVWPVKLVIVIGCVALLAQIALTLIDAARAFLAGSAPDEPPAEHMP